MKIKTLLEAALSWDQKSIAAKNHVVADFLFSNDEVLVWERQGVRISRGISSKLHESSALSVRLETVDGRVSMLRISCTGKASHPCFENFGPCPMPQSESIEGLETMEDLRTYIRAITLAIAPSPMLPFDTPYQEAAE